MPTLHLLGTGASVSDPHRTTTMLAFGDDESTLVVDCGGDVGQRLLEAGIDVEMLDALVITHEHSDHVSGFPLFMQKLWLMDRERPLPVVGIAPALAQTRRAFETFDTSGWDGMFEIEWREIPHEDGAELWKDERWHVTVTPVEHSKPTIGMRVEHSPSGGVAAYSCDTAPVRRFARLARDARVMVHEATGAMEGHSSAEQAAEIAAEAEAERLLLVHLPPGLSESELESARRIFSNVELGKELGAYEF